MAVVQLQFLMNDLSLFQCLQSCRDTNLNRSERSFNLFPTEASNIRITLISYLLLRDISLVSVVTDLTITVWKCHICISVNVM